MITRLHAGHYSRNYKIALICSLAFIILIFVLSPIIKFNKKSSEQVQTLFTISDIPPTTQTQEAQKSAEIIPKTPVIPISGNIIEPEILSDVYINNSLGTQNTSASGGMNPNGAVQASALPFVPRQIKEVLPQNKNKDIKGYIKLSLKIDKTGKVEKYILLVNSTKSSACLQSVLNAAYQSKWQPAKINGLAVEYWIEKVYHFQ